MSKERHCFLQYDVFTNWGQEPRWPLAHISSCPSANYTWHQRWTPVAARFNTSVSAVSLGDQWPNLFWLPAGQNNETIKLVHAEAGWRMTQGQWGNQLPAKLMLQGTAPMPNFLFGWVSRALQRDYFQLFMLFHLCRLPGSKNILLVKATVSG